MKCVFKEFVPMTKSEISLAPHLNLQIIRRTVDFV